MSSSQSLSHHIVSTTGHTVTVHLIHPYLFVFELGGRNGELWMYEPNKAEFSRRGSFQLNDGGTGTYYHVNRETIFLDLERNLFVVPDSNRVPPYGDEDVLWDMLRIFSLDEIQLIRTIDLRGQLIRSECAYALGRLVGMLYPLAENGSELDYDALRDIFVDLSGASGAISTLRVPSYPKSQDTEAENSPYLTLPHPTFATSAGDIIAVSLIPQGMDSSPLGLYRWRSAQLANQQQPSDYIGLECAGNGNPDISSDVSWIVSLGDDAILVCVRTRNVSGIADMDFHETSTLHAVDLSGKSLQKRWSSEPLRGAAQTARDQPTLNRIVVIGQHDFAGHEEDGKIDVQSESEGYGMTSWVVVLDARTGAITKRDVFAHKAEGFTVAFSGFSDAQIGLSAVFGMSDGKLYTVPVDVCIANGFPRTDAGHLSLRAAFDISPGWEIRGGAVGDGCVVLLVSDQEEGDEGTSSQCLYHTW